MRRLIVAALAAIFASLCSVGAQAQNTTGLVVAACGTVVNAFNPARPGPFTVDVNGNLCIGGTITATANLAGFPTVQSTGTPIAVTTGGVSGTLPTGTVVVATNVGTTNGAYCKLGASATTSDQYIAPSGGWFAFTVGANTQLTCITGTSTTTINMVGGSGLPTGISGGGGGGSGGSVTQGTVPWVVSVPTWAGGTLGAMANYGTSPGAVLVPGVNASVTASALPSGAATSALQSTINTTLGSPFQAGGALAANQSVNVSQVNGVTTLTGAGAVGTGSARVAVGQDTTTIAGSAPGTAGTASANVVTVQGVASMTKLLVTPDALPANQSVNLAQVNGVTTLTGTGAVGTGAARVAVGTDTATIAGSAPGTAGTPSANVVTVQGATSMTPITSSINQTTPGTTNGVSFVAAALGGATPYHLLSAASNNSTNVKASAGTVYDITIIQTTTTLGDFRFYDSASAPTCSSSTGVVNNYAIQSNATSPGLHLTFPSGKNFVNGISFCLTGAVADNDNTSFVTGVQINMNYK